MNRTDLQLLADARLADATALLSAGRYGGAYYMVGYAVECALKACITKQIREHDFPDRKLIVDSYTHDLQQLLKLAGLRPQLDARTSTDTAFSINWTTVRDWTETARYSTSTTEVMARDLFTAVTDSASGVLPWLKTLW